VREIGKALDLPPGEIEQVAKLADRRPATGGPNWTSFPDSRGAERAALERAVRARREIAGLPRHVSQHVAG